MYQVNLTTRALTSIGNSGTLSQTAEAACAIKDFVVILGGDMTLRSFTRSGTTLTEVDSLATTVTNFAQLKMTASWLTGFIYVHGGSGDGHQVFNISDSGELSKISNTTLVDGFTGAAPEFRFLPSALEVSAS